LLLSGLLSVSGQARFSAGAWSQDKNLYPTWLPFVSLTRIPWEQSRWKGEDERRSPTLAASAVIYESEQEAVREKLA